MGICSIPHVLQSDIVLSISGLTGRNGEKSRISALQGKMTHWVYRYGVQPGKWSKSLLESPPGYAMNDSSSPDTHAKPRSRYACQMVYNPKTKAIFIHGGISGADEVVPESPAAQTARRNSSDSGSGNTSEAEKENQPEADRQKEVRLNDLWRIKLHRYEYHATSISFSNNSSQARV